MMKQQAWLVLAAFAGLCTYAGGCSDGVLDPGKVCDTDAGCDDGNPCTTDACGADKGLCTNVVIDPAPEGCTKSCTRDTDCHDGDPCTEDLCRPASQTCNNLPFSSPPPGCDNPGGAGGMGGSGGGSAGSATTTDTDAEGDIDPNAGDDSIDIKKSESFVDGSQPWVRIFFKGGWPPSNLLFSWFCSVTFYDDSDAEFGTFTVQHHEPDNPPDQFLMDGFTSAFDYSPEPNGFRVRIQSPIPHSRYRVRAGVLKVDGGTFVEDLAPDALPGFPFSDTQQAYPP